MKRTLCLLLAAIMALALVGCGGDMASSGSAEPVNYADEDFVTDAGKALENRWDEGDKLDVDGMGTDSGAFVTAMTTLTDMEIDALSEYRTANFKDGKLQELAIKYLNNLDEAKVVVAELPSGDYDSFEKWENVYNERTTIIQTLIDKYGLTFSDKYADTVSDITANAKSVKQKDEEKAKVDKLAKSLTFDKKGDGTGYYTYTTKFKNDTGLEFDDLWFNIDLIDKDGTVVEQECISFDEVADGKSYSGDFFTDAKFDRYEITAEYTLKSE